jgi:hypothetical protein
MVSAINLAGLSIVQIYLQSITAREDGVSYWLSTTLYSMGLLTSYNSRRGWYQLSIQRDSREHRYTYLL